MSIVDSILGEGKNEEAKILEAQRIRQEKKRKDENVSGKKPKSK